VGRVRGSRFRRFRDGAWIIQKGVIGSGFAVHGDAVHATGVIPGILGPVLLTTIPHGDIQVVVVIKDHAPGKVSGR